MQRKAIAPEANNRGTSKLELKVLRVCKIDRRPHPLLVIYMDSSSIIMSDYTCCPNIHYLLFIATGVSNCISANGQPITLKYAPWQGQR